MKPEYCGACAFVRSRLVYDWDTLVDKCEFKKIDKDNKERPGPTALQLNPTDIWSSCTVTPAENKLPTFIS